MNPLTCKLAGLAAMVMISSAIGHAGSLKTALVRCERQSCPLGIDAPRPLLDWTLESAARGDVQTAYQILAASDPSLLATEKPDLWDSGKVVSANSLGIEYAGTPLVTGQRVWWRVRVWDRDGKPGPYSEPQWWEMALLAPGDWQAKWISDGKAQAQRDEDFYQAAPAPLLRRGFKIKGPIKRARIYASSPGYHELRLNGGKVGDHQLDPSWTSYAKRVLYVTHDVTALLKPGDNAIGLMLGNGWFNPLPLRFWGQRNFRANLAVGPPCAMVRMDIEYADGTSERIVSDESWRTSEGPVIRNNIYLGEEYDARKEIAGWDTAGFDDANWRPAGIAPAAGGVMQAQAQPPIRVTEEIPAKRITTSDAGPFIYDFGQNFTGITSLHFDAPAGTRYVMRYGELLNKDGSLNPMTSVAGQIKGRRKNADGVESPIGGPGAPDVAWQADAYITKGGGVESYTPRFTFHGFRYMEINALPAGVMGQRMHSDVASVGSFSCSNERFNRIQQMCRNTFVSNLIGVQSDCPHRERLAYGGDIVATSEALLLNYDMHGFYRKTARDWADSALPDGMLTDTAPFVGINYCGVGWAMAHPLLVSQLYRYHGDLRLMEEQYETARRWLLLVARDNPGNIISKGLGDHESLVPAPAPPLVTPLYFQCAEMLAGMARVLGREDDVTVFTALAARIRNAYQNGFLDENTGIAGPGTQAAQAFALYSGLVPAAVRPLAVERLLEDIRGKHQGHLSTGIFGTKFMLDALSAEDHAEAAYGIVNQAAMPGWGWMLENGATTLWEHWAGSDNTFSQNHPMFGSVSQWFFNWLGGIRPASDAVGFDKILIAPQPVADLTWAKAQYRSVRGLVKSEWKHDGGKFELHVAIPVGATATVFVPARNAASVDEGGLPASEAGGVRFLRMERGAAVFAVGSGSYDFASSWTAKGK